jgi:hypothetical protein
MRESRSSCGKNSIERVRFLSIMGRERKGSQMSEAKSAGAGGAGSGRSCLLYGCLTLVVLMIAVAVGTFFLGRYAINRLANFVEQYTETSPMAMERVEMPEEEYASLETRLKDFQTALKDGRRIAPLVLTGRELNVLIARHPELGAWRDRLHVELEGTQVKGQVSLPLDELARIPGFSRLAGRYLNGAALLGVRLENGRLDVRVDSLEVKGQPLPDEVLSQLRLHNLAQDLEKNEQLSETLGQLRSIEVADGEVTIKAAGSE